MKLPLRSRPFSVRVLMVFCCCPKLRSFSSTSSSTAVQTIAHFNAPVTIPVLNFLPETQNPNNLVRFISASLKQKNTSLWSDLLDQGIFAKFNHHDLSRILLRCQSDSSAALAFFNWVRNHLGLAPNVQNFCIIIHILVWCKKFKQGMNMLLDLVQQIGKTDVPKGMNVFDSLLVCAGTCNFEPAVFDMLIKAYLRSGKVKESFQTYKGMTKLGFVPSLNVSNCLIISLAKMGYCAKCWWVYEEMCRIGIQPNSFTFHTLLNMLCKEGDVDKVNTFLERIEEEGFDPDIVTYNMLLHHYCKIGRPKDAFHLYNIMLRRNVIPDLVTYTTLIRCLCHGGSVMEAHRLFNLMVHRGLKPDIVAYNTLIHGYCKEGMMKVARSLLFDMIGNHVHPDNFTCQILINGYLQSDRMITAMNMVLEFTHLGIEISEETYRHLILALCKDDRPFAAKSLFDKMSGYGYIPCKKMYNEMIECLCRSNFVKEAMDLKVEMMESRGMKPDLGTYRAIMGCLCALDRSKEGFLLMQEMVESGLVPDVEMCRGLLNVQCKMKNIGDAELLLRFFAEKAQIFDSVCYNTVSRAVVEECNVAELINFQVRMGKLGFVPDAVTCKYAIQGMQKSICEGSCTTC